MPVKHFFDFTISAGILLTVLTILIGGAMKWQHLVDELKYETENRVRADTIYHDRVEASHDMLKRDIEEIEKQLNACKINQR